MAETAKSGVPEKAEGEMAESGAAEYTGSGTRETDGINRAERSEETEKDETETELKIRAYGDITDKTSYIQMEQEYSAENGETETEYVYSIYAVERFKVFIKSFCLFFYCLLGIVADRRC